MHECGPHCLLHDPVDWNMAEQPKSTYQSKRPEPMPFEIHEHVRESLESASLFQPTPLLPSPLWSQRPSHIVFPPQRYLYNANPHPLDSEIIALDEPHVYFIKEGNDYSCEDVISSTRFIHAFFSDFPGDEIAKKTLDGVTHLKSKHRTNYKYYGCDTVEDIKKCWDRSRDLGTMLHLEIEKYLNQESVCVGVENEKCWQQFLNFYGDEKFRNWDVYRTEWAIFDRDKRIAGMIDYLGIRDDGSYVIMDWKRAENISDCCFNRFRRLPAIKGYGPCGEFDNCNFITYSLQLNLYKYILEKYYGIRVSKMLLVQMHPTLTDVDHKGVKRPLPVVIMVPHLQETIAKMLACRVVRKRQ